MKTAAFKAMFPAGLKICLCTGGGSDVVGQEEADSKTESETENTQLQSQ